MTIDRLACPVAATETLMRRSDPVEIPLRPVMTMGVRTLIVEALPTVAGQFRCMRKRTPKCRRHDVMGDTLVICDRAKESLKWTDDVRSLFIELDSNGLDAPVAVR
mmetsp:Transcript_2134/g.4373  ORF Transcript_2134/g.4373 Transcript_2134/m.4373 type:complete len:106 (-) Transcript_2134:377-694(-)